MSMPGFGFVGGPEDFAELMRRQQEEAAHRDMIGSDMRNQITDLLERQSDHDLWLMWMVILGIISHQAEGIRMTGYLERMLHDKGVCVGCGEKPCKDEQKMRESLEELKDGPLTVLPTTLPGKLEVEYFKLLAEYNMEEDPNEVNPNRLRCKGCGLEYVNLEDRMVKGVTDCHGCHMKSAQG